MPTLTVTEKEHWKERIAHRIDKRIETILAAEPGFMDRVQRDARQRSLVSLGLADGQAELDDIEKQKAALEKRSGQTLRALLARVRGVSPEDVDAPNYQFQYTGEINSAVGRRQTVHEDELLAESEIGREILRLRQEQENLLDTVWLATSPTQLKTLWLKVNQLLASEPSQLERDALEIEPVQD